MTDEYTTFISENADYISIQSYLAMNDNVKKINNDMTQHFSFFEDADKLPESFLVFKYFGEDAFSNEKFNDEGDYLNILSKITVFEITFKDSGKVFVTDTVNGHVDLWIQQSELANQFASSLEGQDAVDFIYIFSELYSEFKEQSSFNSEAATITF